MAIQIGLSFPVAKDPPLRILCEALTSAVTCSHGVTCDVTLALA